MYYVVDPYKLKDLEEQFDSLIDARKQAHIEQLRHRAEYVVVRGHKYIYPDELTGSARVSKCPHTFLKLSDFKKIIEKQYRNLENAIKDAKIAAKFDEVETAIVSIEKI